jgi:tRNA threonylcarbamoyladenosine biosynthesis protein TsaE
MEELSLRSNSEEQTIAFGHDFASRLEVGDVVALYGELGAGKTEFVKGICSYFQVADIVTSPTFSIINQYNGETPQGEALRIYHLDLYRIASTDELAGVGFDDCVFSHDAIKLVEWPERAEHMMPPHYAVRINADTVNDDMRHIDIVFVREPHGALKA